MKIFGVIALSAMLSLCVPASAPAENRVALELVLAVDASSSVSPQEYRLQVSGYVQAFQDEDVIAAIRALKPAGLAVTYVEWSGSYQQVQSVGWTHVHDGESASNFAQAIAANTNQLQGTGTALGEAVIYSVDLFEGNAFVGDRRTIDVSADDRYNAGSSPTHARWIALNNNVTINGLAVDTTGELAVYFQNNVIGGAGAFVLTATSFDDFAAAIKKKLLRELQGKDLVAILSTPLRSSDVK